MSAIIEYLKLIPKGIANIENIVKGHINDIKLRYNHLPKDQQEEILKRRIICEGCPYNSKLAQSSEEYVLLFNHNYKTDRHDFHCSLCACPILQKTASLESNCGLEEYNATHSNNPQPLKWAKYES